VHCGPSSCGSLRVPGGSLDLHVHGSYAESPLPVDNNHPLKYLQVPDRDGRCEVSGLSAREKGLRDRILLNKMRNGFVERPKPSVAMSAGDIGNGRNTSQVQELLESESVYPSMKAYKSLPDIRQVGEMGSELDVRGDGGKEAMVSPSTIRKGYGTVTVDKLGGLKGYPDKKFSKSLSSSTSETMKPLRPKSKSRRGDVDLRQTIAATLDLSELPDLNITRPPPRRS